MDYVFGFYRFVFARPFFAKFNKFLVSLGLRGLGILNYKSDDISGEAYFLKRHLSEIASPVCVDVGANVGHYSNKILSVAPGARIIAFEPHPRNYEKLNSSLGRLDNVRLYNFACGDVKGDLELFDYRSQDRSSHASLYRGVIESIHKAESVSHRVPVVKLDDILNSEGINKIDLLKIDVEGHEMRVLIGAENHIRKGLVDCIHFEFNEMNVVSRVFFKDIYDFLPDYKFYRLLPKGMLEIKAYSPIFCELFAYQNIVAFTKWQGATQVRKGTSCLSG